VLRVFSSKAFLLLSLTFCYFPLNYDILSSNSFSRRKMSQAVKLLTRIHEVPSSNTGRNTDYHL
jgi:hypothetical protein